MEIPASHLRLFFFCQMLGTSRKSTVVVRAYRAVKHASKQTRRFTSEVISLAVLWTDYRTYQDNLGEFCFVNNAIDAIFHW